jgi:glutaryl-CoA dehydrogenase
MTQAARKAHGPSPLAEFNWEDPLDLESQLSEDERMIRDTARAFCADKLMPRVQKAFREERFDREIMNELGEVGLLGMMNSEAYGGSGLGYVA